ncbi:MAG: PAS domain-containing sensor histidine kinase [Pseudomonadota bacterium]
MEKRCDIPEDRDRALENFHRHCADAAHPYDQVVRYRHADGSTVWVRCRGLAVRDGQGKPTRMFGAHTDITAQMRAEESLRREIRASEATNDELRAFAFAVSHDLRAPTNTVKLLISEMREMLGPREPEVAELLTLADETLARMGDLVTDVLYYMRVVGEDLELGDVDLSALAEETVADLADDIQTAGARVTLEPLPKVRASEVQMRLLLQNLLSNAVKFRVPDRVPEIRVKPIVDRADRLAFAVEDNGIGIPTDGQGQIFQMFNRLNLRESYPGTGLGLAISRRAVVNHGGWIDVASTPGRGTTFTVHLPRSQG